MTKKLKKYMSYTLSVVLLVLLPLHGCRVSTGRQLRPVILPPSIADSSSDYICIPPRDYDEIEQGIIDCGGSLITTKAFASCPKCDDCKESFVDKITPYVAFMAGVLVCGFVGGVALKAAGRLVD